MVKIFSDVPLRWEFRLHRALLTDLELLNMEWIGIMLMKTMMAKTRGPLTRTCMYQNLNATVWLIPYEQWSDRVVSGSLIKTGLDLEFVIFWWIFWQTRPLIRTSTCVIKHVQSSCPPAGRTFPIHGIHLLLILVFIRLETFIFYQAGFQ